MKVLKIVIISVMMISSIMIISSCNSTNQSIVAQNETIDLQNNNNEINIDINNQNQTYEQIETTTIQVTEDSKQETTINEQNKTIEEIQNDESKNVNSKNILVAYFSATGTTKKVAEKIAELTNADIYEIVPLNPYSDDDLNWNDKNSRSTKEMDDKNVRPEIGSNDIDLTSYTTIYLGYPIWWGDAPRIMSTFVEKYNFDGKTIIPFCTSGGSSIGRSGSNLADLSKTGNWLKGERLNSSADEKNIKNFISESLKR